MNRAKVIVHMHTSIDGKIDGKYGRQEKGQLSGEFYAQQLFRLSSANANGATTVAKYAATGTLDLTPFEGAQVPYENWLPQIQADTWDIAFDRQGRMAWTRNYFEYGGKKSRVIEVVTTQASPAYLAFLQSMEIPYIIGGDQELNLDLVLKVLKDYGIEAISLAGGAIIDGAFLKAGLVDEISVVVTPFVSGDNAVPGIFNTNGQFVNQQFKIETMQALADGGVYLRYVAKR